MQKLLFVQLSQCYGMDDMQSQYLVSTMQSFLKITVFLACGLLVACTPSITKTSGAEPSSSSTGSSDATDVQGAESKMIKGYADIPIPANGVLIVSESLLLNSGEQWLGRAVLESKLDANSAFEYFRENMSKQGWMTITMVQSQVSILTFEKGSRIATLQIQQRIGGASSVSVTVAPRETAVLAN